MSRTGGRGRGGATGQSADRVPLSRARIVEAGLDFIDDQGLAGLTMRQLGGRLGVEAMALYRYVPGKEELLDAIVERLMASLAADEQVLSSPVDGWQDFLARLAHGVRRLALAHPKAFPLVAARPPEAPWLRPPLRSLHWVEVFLHGLGSEGFSEEEAVACYRAFTSFLIGHLLLEVAGLGADVGPLDVLATEGGSSQAGRGPDGLADYPTVRTLRAQLSEDRSDVEFEESLESLLDRLAVLRQGHAD